MYWKYSCLSNPQVLGKMFLNLPSLRHESLCWVRNLIYWLKLVFLVVYFIVHIAIKKSSSQLPPHSLINWGGKKPLKLSVSLSLSEPVTHTEHKKEKGRHFVI